MERRPKKMEARPPALIDAIVRLLIPPACREHVLGDLWERYSSPLGYAIDALRTIPFVIASQVRRTWMPPLLGMQAVMLFVFYGGLLKQRGEAGAPLWLCAAIPVAAAIFAIIARDVYASRKPHRFLDAALSAAAAVSGALLTQGILALTYSAALLSSRNALIGTCVGFAIVCLSRNTVPRGGACAKPVWVIGSTASLDELVREVRQFDRRIRYRNRQELAASVFILATFSFFFWRTTDPLARVGVGLVMAGTLSIAYRILRRGGAAPVPGTPSFIALRDFYRVKLERQRDLCRTVRWWYVLPLIPGMTLLTFASEPKVLGLFLVVGILSIKLNDRAVGSLQRTIDSVATLEEKP
jgi:hypothetical protein